MPASLSRESFLALADDLLIQDLSYARLDVSRDYVLPTGEGRLKLDRLAFGQKRHDQESSCLAAHFCPAGRERDRLIAAATLLAVPLGFFGRPDGAVDLVQWRSDGEPRVEELADPAEFAGYVKEHANQLRASVLLEAKRPSGRQLTFVDAGLLDFAFQAAPAELPSVYQDLTAEAAAQIRRLRPACQDPREAALRATILIFGARVLRDKGALSGSRNDAIALMREAGSSKRFPTFFRETQWQDIPPDVLGRIADRLMQWRFDFLSPYGLGMLYQHAFVDDDLRRKLAIYYTPLAISQFILDHLPIGDIPSGQRSALDPTAGSGSFLLTALRRIRQLHEQETGAAPSAAWCRRMIHGRDKDPFACWIAALSLMNETRLNEWDIQQTDLDDLDLRSISRRPTIVIGNPPFALTRVAIHKAVSRLPDGGLLGFVLPYKYRGQVSSAAERSRKELLSTCEILQIADLPAGVFAQATEPSMVLLARKRTGGPLPTWMIRERSIEGPLSDYRSRVLRGDFAEPREVPQREWLLQKHALMKSPLLTGLWTRLRELPKLGALCEGPHAGIQIRGPRSGKDSSGSLLLTETNPGGAVPYLKDIGRARSCFGLPPDVSVSYLDYYEHRDELEEERDPAHMEAQKVILPRTVDTQRAWRLMAYVDDVGYFVANTFLYALPKPSGPSLWLTAAMLNSAVANAWLQEHSRERNINVRLLGELPFAELNPEQAELLSEMAFGLVRLQQRRPSGRPQHERSMPGMACGVPPWTDWLVRAMMTHVDRLLLDAYGLTKRERDTVYSLCPLEDRPGLPGDPPRGAIDTARVETRGARGLLRASGRVVALDNEKGLAGMAVDGLALGVPVPVALDALPEGTRVLGCHVRLRSFLGAGRLEEVVISEIEPFPQADRPRSEILAELREIAKPSPGESNVEQ